MGRTGTGFVAGDNLVSSEIVNRFPVIFFQDMCILQISYGLRCLETKRTVTES